MTTFDLIKELSEKRNKNVKEVAKELGFGENAFYKWKNSSPSADNLRKVADYFNVSVDYLLGREEEKLSSKDLDDLLDNAMSFDGKPMTEHDREVIRAYLQGKFGE